MPKSTKSLSVKRTTVKDLSKKSKPLSAKELKKVKGGIIAVLRKAGDKPVE